MDENNTLNYGEYTISNNAVSSRFSRFTLKLYNLTMKPDIKLIATRIRKAREQAGYTQVDMADALGMSQANINKLELGKGNLTLNNLFKIADLFGLSPVYFLGGVEVNLEPEEEELITLYRSLPRSGPYRPLAYRSLLSMVETIQQMKTNGLE